MWSKFRCLAVDPHLQMQGAPQLFRSAYFPPPPISAFWLLCTLLSLRSLSGFPTVNHRWASLWTSWRDWEDCTPVVDNLVSGQFPSVLMRWGILHLQPLTCGLPQGSRLSPMRVKQTARQRDQSMFISRKVSLCFASEVYYFFINCIAFSDITFVIEISVSSSSSSSF